MTMSNMDATSGLNKLRAASCSLLLLLLTLALVASSLLVARYAVAASSWWLSLLAITVCLLGLCTWIQLAASRAGRASRWRIMLARQMALSRAQRTVSGGAMGPDLFVGRTARSGSDAMRAGLRGHPHVAVIPLDCELDAQMPYRVPGPPPPPPYAVSDLPPSYCATAATPPGEDAAAPAAPATPTAPAPPPGTELPPPYSVAIKRDALVQDAAAVLEVAPSQHHRHQQQQPRPPPVAAQSGDQGRQDAQRRSRVVLWY